MADPHRRRKRLPLGRFGRPVLARVKLTLSYLAFLILAGTGAAALLYYTLRFVPTVPIGTATQFTPSRSDLWAALWPRLWEVGLVLLIVGLIGGWVLSSLMLRPLALISNVARRVEAGNLDQRVRMVRNHDEFKDVADALDSMLDRLQGVLEEQSRFVANASHELRTPFAVMKSILDVAAVDVDGRDIDVLIRKLSNTNRRGVEIVEALLLLSSADRFDNLERDPVDLARIIIDSLDDVRAEADNAGIKIHHELVGGCVTGNSSLIRQLVTNLLINGIRHNLPTGGTLTISTSADTQGNIVLTVSSTGARIDESQLDFLTEPFVRGAGRVATSSEGRTGTGLGLAIVAQVVRAHNASLVLRAPDAGGLEVRVTFPPLAEAPTPTYAGHIRSR